MFFIACEKYEPINDGTVVIEATDVEIGNGGIDTVKVYIVKLTSDGKNWVYNEIASVKFKNEGFILNIPATIPDEYL